MQHATQNATVDENAPRFNRWCRWIALAWLIVSIVGSQLVRPTYQDLSGIYIGGLVARVGAWDALYPVPANTRFYVGEAAVQKEKLLALASQHGVKELNPYLNPPWQAVLFYPMGWLTYQQAHWAWVILLVACTWGVTMQAGTTFTRCAGNSDRSSKLAGVVTLVVAFSILAYRSVRVQNMSPIMALLIGVVGIGFTMPETTRRSLSSAVAVTLGAVMKMATVALLPVAVAMRRWRLVVVTVVLGVAFIALSIAVAGRATFQEFSSRIAPTLGGSSTNPGNKSLQSFLIRIHHDQPLAGGELLAFRALQAITLIATLALIWMPRREGWGSYWSSPPRVFAACCALVAWLLIFSPLCWEHYLIYFCPFWGWLAWEASTGGAVRRVVAIGAILLHWFPLPVLRGHPVPEPINSYMLGGLFLVLGLAWWRLWTTSDRSGLAT